MLHLLTAWLRIRVLVGHVLLSMAHIVFSQLFILERTQYVSCRSLRAAAVEDGFGVEVGG
jgi:hypothetical protein